MTCYHPLSTTREGRREQNPITEDKDRLGWGSCVGDFLGSCMKPGGRARSTPQKEARVGVEETSPEPAWLTSSHLWDLDLPGRMKGWAAGDNDEVERCLGERRKRPGRWPPESGETSARERRGCCGRWGSSGEPSLATLYLSSTALLHYLGSRVSDYNNLFDLQLLV